MAMVRNTGNAVKETNLVLKSFADHVTKSDVLTMLSTPKMAEKLASTNSDGLLGLYYYDPMATKAMATVIIKQAKNSLELEEKTGKPNGILEEVVELYLSSKVANICQESIAVGVDKMIYSIEMLHNALGSDAKATMSVIDRINREVNSTEDIVFGMLIVQNIRTKLLGINDMGRKMEIVANTIEDMRDFREIYKDLNEK